MGEIAVLYKIVSKAMEILSDAMTGAGLLGIIGTAILLTVSWIGSDSDADDTAGH